MQKEIGWMPVSFLIKETRAPSVSKPNYFLTAIATTTSITVSTTRNSISYRNPFCPTPVVSYVIELHRAFLPFSSEVV